MARLFLALLALLGAASAAAQVYRWTDESGRVTYGSQPPPSAKAKVVQDRIQSYSGAPQVQRAPGSRVATSTQAVVMYATSWCGYCKEARAYFARNRIAYVEYDVEKNPTAKAEFQRLGGRGVPLIVHGSSLMTGFSEQAFEALVASSAR
jgi:glutaredoxin